MDNSNKSPKEMDVEQNSDEVIDDLLQRYSNCLQQVSKSRVELVELQLDTENMNASGVLFQIEINKITSNLDDQVSNDQSESNDEHIMGETKESKDPVEHPTNP
uniref:Uncharacterized protein n=1 Tax=Cacopsylla melanoneura TaxID=428564 RepID=A0A8D8VYM6_9HEMI